VIRYSLSRLAQKDLVAIRDYYLEKRSLRIGAEDTRGYREGLSRPGANSTVGA
jgi:hypothetical protein